MTAAELLVQGLQRRSIDWMATLCGHGLDPLFFAAKEAGMRMIDTRNEQTAAYVADAYGRLTGRPGVCAVSSGVAVANALSGVASSWFDRGPMLLLSGAAADATAGLGHFQELDQVTLARPITKDSTCIHVAARTAEMLDAALSLAVGSPPGPVHLMFPMDVQRTEVPDSAVVGPSPLASSSGCLHDDTSNVAEALLASSKPLVVGGSGLFYSGCGAGMLAFGEEFRIPVVTPIWDRGVVNRPSPVFMGVIGAATGGPKILSEADCILMAGAESDYRVGYLRPPAVRPDVRVLRFGRDWRELAASLRARSWEGCASWQAVCQQRREEHRQSVEQRARQQSQGRLHALHVIQAIQSVLDTDPVFLIDGGSIGQWAHQLLCSDRYPSTFLTCGRSGVVGWGIGGAMAARMAHADRPVILLSGDGSFTFNVGDLEVAVRQKLPFTAIVADDEAWGITMTGHLQQFGAPVSSSLGPIAFDRLAQSLGAEGIRVNSAEGLNQALRSAIRSPAVTVIHVPIVGGNPA